MKFQPVSFPEGFECKFGDLLYTLFRQNPEAASRILASVGECDAKYDLSKQQVGSMFLGSVNGSSPRS